MPRIDADLSSVGDQPGKPGKDKIRAETSRVRALTLENIHNVPDDLKALSHWVCYRFDPRDNGKLGKPPVNPDTGKPQSWKDPGNFLTFDQAVAALQANKPGNLAGVGLVFTGEEPYSGIDIDCCIDTDRKPSDQARGILERTGTYSEVSPSGKGLRIIGGGKLPDGDAGGKCGDFEAYSSGRFLTLTGDRFGHDDIREFSDDLAWFRETFTRGGAQKEKKGHEYKLTSSPSCAPAGNLSDEEIIKLIERAKNGAAVLALINGGGHADQSAGDAALIGHFIFYSEDADQIERLMRNSRRVREKWDTTRGQETFIRYEIRRALERYQGKRYDATRRKEMKKAGLSPRANQQRKTSDEVPTIRVTMGAGTLRAMTDAAIGSLLAAKADIFQRAGELVAVRADEKANLPGITWPCGEPRISAISPATMREMLDSSAEWERFDSREDAWCLTRVPRDVTECLMARGEWPFRILTMTTETPTMLRNGDIVDRPGWDPSSGILFTPKPGESWNIPRNPTPREIDAACFLLRECFYDFPFEKPCHRGAAVAAVLTMLTGMSYANRPLFLVGANIRGAGKTLLTDVVSIIASGRGLPKMIAGEDQNEDRKRITALAMAGARTILVDNLASRFGNAAIDAALTCDGIWEDRLLAQNKTWRGPLFMTWFATGNNVEVVGDLARRVVPIGMLSDQDRPERRTGFKHPDLKSWARERRVDLATAALTILRGFVCAGRPGQNLFNFGSFEEWAELVRNAVVWAGFSDPCEGNEDIQQKADTDVITFSSVLRSWYDLFRTIPNTLTRVSKMVPDDKLTALTDALTELAPNERGPGWNARKVGHLFKRFEKRVIRVKTLQGQTIRLRIESVGGTNSGAAWKVSEVAEVIDF